MGAEVMVHFYPKEEIERRLSQAADQYYDDRRSRMRYLPFPILSKENSTGGNIGCAYYGGSAAAGLITLIFANGWQLWWTVAAAVPAVDILATLPVLFVATKRTALRIQEKKAQRLMTRVSREMFDIALSDHDPIRLAPRNFDLVKVQLKNIFVTAGENKITEAQK